MKKLLLAFLFPVIALSQSNQVLYTETTPVDTFLAANPGSTLNSIDNSGVHIRIGKTYTLIASPGLTYQSGGQWQITKAQIEQLPANAGWVQTGTPGNVSISGNGADKHVVVAGSKAKLDFLLPSLAYKSDKTFTFQSGGQTWTLNLLPTGYHMQTTITSKHGNGQYSFTHNAFGATLSVDPSGNLTTGSDLITTRAVIIGADKKTYACSAWAVNPGNVSFSCDDTALPATAFPYVIDPTTITINGSGYSCSGAYGTNDDGTTCTLVSSDCCGWAWYGTNFSVSVPAGAVIQTANVTVSPVNESYQLNCNWVQNLTSSYGTTSGNGYQDYGYLNYTVPSSQLASLANSTVQYQFGVDANPDTCTAQVADSATLTVSYNVYLPPQLPSGLNFSAYANSWTNVTFTVSDLNGYGNLNPSQYMVINNSLSYSGGCNATFVVPYFYQLNDAGNRLNWLEFGSNTSSSDGTCGIQSTGSSLGSSGCSSGCTGSLTFSVPVYFYVGGTRNIYLNFTNGDNQTTGWVYVGTISLTPQTVSAPTISPGGGTYNSSPSITLNTATSGATIRYTTDGSTPSETAGTVYTGPFTIAASGTVKAIAYLVNWYDSAISTTSYTLQASPPAPSPAAGTYTSNQSVTLSTSAPAATIYYTTNGSTPACGSGTVYSGAIPVTGTPNVTTTTTIKAIACKTGWTTSTVSSSTFTITGAAVPPSFSPSAGTYQSSQSIALSTATSGATIRYTTDGSTPTETYGTVYSGPIALYTTPNLATTTTIRAIAYESGWIDSAITNATYTITGTVAAPQFSPPGGVYTATQTVTITTATPGSTIRYTTDGTTPSETHGTVYSGAITLSGQTTTIQAIAYLAAWTDSPIASAGYYYSDPTGGTGGKGPGTGTPNADSGNGLDPRRVGVRAFGTYWGAAGEQIDTTSGNLNYSLPLLKILSRGGWSIGAMLNYNSQMWRKDSAGTWLMGYDVGYGLGWQIQIGSLVPVWGTSQIDHYIYTDATGAEYNLSVNNGGVWTSVEGVYLSYDSNANRIYQNDGSFRVMGCTSSGGEQDAGSMYPTLIEDSNGNQIQIAYAPGAGSGGAANTSARIQYIYDPRTPNYRAGYPLNPTYSFSYNSDPIPHLSSISGQPGEGYTFNYGSQALNSPLDSSSFGTSKVLQSVTVTGMGASYTFTYGSSGEMASATTLMGGTLAWSYSSCLYSGGISQREVVSRSMTAGFSNSWSITHSDGCAGGQTYHAATTVADSGAASDKIYTAGTPVTNYVVPVAYDEAVHGGAASLHKDFGWTEDSSGHVYMNSVTTTLSPNTPSTTQTKTVQTLDAYGNLSQSQVYDYGNLGTPARTYNYTYLSGSNYTPIYIRNRLSTATVTSPTYLNGNPYYTAVLYYDYVPSLSCCALQDPSPGVPPPLHDSAYDVNHTYRGNPIAISDINGTENLMYQITGVPYQAKDGAGRIVNITPDGTYSLPAVLTPNGNSNLATSLTYASNWALTSVTGPNGATSTTSYDQFGRPQSSTSSDGAVTNYAYSFNPAAQTAAISTGSTTQWTKTILDGFGRVVSVLTGHDSTTVNEVDTKYAACACSPLGKMSAVSLPYAPGGTPVWTTYTYDSSGRTLTITKPDGASKTTYAYSGNTTKVTDPAGKWKQNTTDAFGNLITVTEPDPNNQPNGTLATTYTYDSANRLTQVTMPRSNGTQTRSFTWSGSDLASATNPENGTVSYQYDGAHHVTLRTDAKGQQTQYTYDAYGRLTLVHHTPDVISVQIPSGQQLLPSQDINYYYDNNPFVSSFSQNAWGRLTAITFGGSSVIYGNVTASYTLSLAPTYMYSYNQAGRVTDQRFRITSTFTDVANPLVNDFDALYTGDNQGRMTARNGPDANYTYTFDSMGRMSTMTEAGSTIATAQYSAAGQLTSLTYDTFTETRTYNSLLQLTRQTVSGVMDMQYIYSATQNNGRITSSIDGVVGETVNYTYDGLNRLATAASTSASWGQQYTYDGFGNLTGMQGAAVWSYPVNSPPSGYDANGLAGGGGTNSWNVENRLVASPGISAGTNFYGYDPYGKRVFQAYMPPSGSTSPLAQAYFYTLDGRKVANIQCTASIFPDGTTSLSGCALSGAGSLYFGGKLIRSNGVTVATDRLGTVRGNVNGERMSYLPYGQERTSTADGREKFGTYFRDGLSQDYADQRYYNPELGAFWSPDPGGIKTADPTNPLSWNRYLYSLGDPVNFNDPTGKIACLDEDENCWDEWDDNSDIGGGGGGGGTASSSIQYACAPGYVPDANSDGGCDPVVWGSNGGNGGPILGASGQQLSSIAIGAFFYGGPQSTGSITGEANGVYSCDTTDGCGASGWFAGNISLGNSGSGAGLGLGFEIGPDGKPEPLLQGYLGPAGAFIGPLGGLYGLWLGSTGPGSGPNGESGAGVGIYINLNGTAPKPSGTPVNSPATTGCPAWVYQTCVP